jgi:hypothetical protein
MQRLFFRESVIVPTCVLATASFALAACSSSGGAHSHTPTPQTTSSSQSASSSAAAEPTTGSGAVAAIEANYAAFFNGKTSLSRRIALLQDGPMFRAAIKTQSSNSFASSASAKVSSVKLTGANQASVVYTISALGSPLLKNAHGVAVYQGGVWKVGADVFCHLLKLEAAGSSAGLPSVCTT